MQIAQTTLNLYNEAQNRLPGVDAAPGAGFGGLIGSLLQAIMVIAALSVLLYLIWGAIDWISAGGDSGKVQKARAKITGSVIGMLVLASVVALFIVLQQFLGINVLRFSGSAGSSSTNTTAPASGGTAAGTCAGGVRIGERRNDGGAGGYCSGGGAAIVECHGPDSHLSYPHFDPCSCTTGSQLSGYDFGSC